MTKEDLQTIVNLLYTGRWNLNIQELETTVRPIITKLLAEIQKQTPTTPDEIKSNS